ncbi:hypothetical protein [Rhizobium rhizogenes]|uniref:hypothetical protein n=1 Tax=Rhizobium rhizogenes TaxID=359 RepID=UPI00226FD5E2|nr:hypothetical protein [Rhizobium rhizogenes]
MNKAAPVRAMYPSWRSVFVGAALGLAIGGVLYKTVLGTTFAVAVIQAGRIGGEQSQDTRITPQLVIDRRGAPQILIDRLQTPEFAKQIAESIGDPSLLQALPARQYGGNAKLGVRVVSDGTLVELRVLLDDPQQALAVATAAAKLAMDADNEMLSLARDAYTQRIAELQKQAADQQMVSEKIIKALEQNETSSTLLAAASESQSQLHSLSQAIWTLKTGSLPPAAQNSAIFTAPALARPLIRNLWLTLLIAATGGAALGYAFGLSTRFARLSVENQH